VTAQSKRNLTYFFWKDVKENEMEWILIILMTNGRSLEVPIATTTATFSSKRACVQGGNNIVNEFSNNYISVRTYCVPK